MDYLEVVFLYIFEIAVGAHLQLIACLFVGHDDAVSMLLQGTDGPCLCDRTFHSSFEGLCLMVSIDKDHHLAGIHHRTHADGQRVLGYFVDIVIEETAVGNDGVGGERLDACAAYQT